VRRFYCLMLLLAVWIFTGCGQAKIQPDNLKLTISLRTALSTQNSEWLDQNIAAIETRRTAGEMGDEEYAAFQAIIAQAKAGEWQAAERAAVKLQKAQRPSQEQIDRLPKLH
jgi:hypothetical protein